MSKNKKALIAFLVFDVIVVAAFLGYRALQTKGDPRDPYAWVAIDESYVPKNDVETFIKTDAETRDALPVFIRNYGADQKILKRFKGKQFARPSVNVLNMFFKGLDDWMIVDIKYKTETEREVVRTVLYIFQNKQWKVGDTGSFLE